MFKKRALFEVGEYVKVKTLAELLYEFGDDLSSECDFIEEMHEYCGQVYKVSGVDHSSVTDLFYYELDCGDDWSFDERVLDYMEPPADSGTPVITMAYDELF